MIKMASQSDTVHKSRKKDKTAIQKQIAFEWLLLYWLKKKFLLQLCKYFLFARKRRLDQALV